ncbi:death domain-containing protein CRADD isoform X2 [Labrus bergylta]|uniref:death domain-containing protein CRADD isoform X2 n=1 Tax=Labrus bergylta TaxID=56723 RepID=UPI0009B44A18|nr:uncharacterized protein LOC110001048 isoform X2 [Labrus bergylta]
MDPEHRALLRRHRLYLSGQLLVSDSIVPFLYQEDVLTEAQVEDVQSQPTDTRRTLRLLDLLPSRGPRAFPLFLRALEDFSWVRDRLLLELRTPPGPEPGASSTDYKRCYLRLSLRRRVPAPRLASPEGPVRSGSVPAGVTNRGGVRGGADGSGSVGGGRVQVSVGSRSLHAGGRSLRSDSVETA